MSLFNINAAIDSVSSSISGLLGDVIEGTSHFADDVFGGISDAAKQYIDEAGNVLVDSIAGNWQFERGANGDVATDVPASSDRAGNISANSHATITSGLSTPLTVGLAVAATITLLGGMALLSGRKR